MLVISALAETQVEPLPIDTMYKQNDDAVPIDITKSGTLEGTEVINVEEKLDVMPVRCMPACPFIYKPVCGGLAGEIEETFPNECQFRLRNCLNRTSKFYFSQLNVFGSKCNICCRLGYITYWKMHLSLSDYGKYQKFSEKENVLEGVKEKV